MRRVTKEDMLFALQGSGCDCATIARNLNALLFADNDEYRPITMDIGSWLCADRYYKIMSPGGMSVWGWDTLPPSNEQYYGRPDFAPDCQSEAA